ncbi:hypothetical protein D0T53_04245 [Dysgonomonas sp. 216]|nr:hypothetical protein [Dysgonomonas sp. 216]
MIFTACPDDNYNAINLKNISQRNVVIYIGGEDYGEPTYPDTLLPNKNRTKPIFNDYTRFGFTKDLKHSKVCVFFLDQDTIAKYGWDKVRDDYMILKRYDVNEQYLRQKEVNWTIVYEDEK